MTLLSALATAAAQRTVEVAPPVLLHESSAGESVDASFQVKNPSTQSFRIRVYVADWHYDQEGTPIYLDGGTLPRSVAPYVTFNPSQVLLEPGEAVDVRYTVDLPDDATPGSHWGVLFVEAEDPDPDPGFTLARFNVRVGHVVYVNVPPLTRSGRIASIFGAPPQGPDDSYALWIEYENTGDTVQRLDGYVELRDEAGTVLFTDPLPSEVSLPGDAVGREYRIFGPLDPGPYTALVVYNYGDPTIDVVADYPFVLDVALREPPEPEPAGDADAPGDGE